MTLKEEMLAFLIERFGNEENSDFDREAAIYWFASDYHGGQASELYEVLSTSEFSPGLTHNSVRDEGELAEEMYNALESEGKRFLK